MGAKLLCERLFALAANRPGAPFLVERGRVTGAAEMAGRVSALASVLRDLGVGRGDRATIWLPRSRETVEAFFAVALRGAAAVLVNPAWTLDMVVRALRGAPVDVLFATGRAARRLAERADLPPIRAVVAPDGPPGLPWPERPEFRGPPEILARWTEPAAILPVLAGADDPLPAVFCHESLVAGATGFAGLLGLDPDDRVLYLGSLASGCGLEHFAAAVVAGSALVLETSPMTADVLDTVASKGATIVPGRPEVFRELVAARRHRPEPLPRLRAMVCAGAALPPRLTEALLASLPGAALYLTYGLTECQRVAAVPPGRLPVAPGVLGLPIPGVEVVLVDDGGEACPTGGAGEIAVRGPQVFAGYLGDGAATARRLKPVGGGGPALFTGDFGRWDGDLLVLTGRRSSPLRSGGERVDGGEVRRVLLACEMVEDAELSAGTDADGLDCVRAAVTFRPGIPPDLPALRAHLLRRLPPFMLPHLRVTNSGSDPKPPN
jgi:acyl-CoA synthetase (AMP-forming)/AMP-acid ligase II